MKKKALRTWIKENREQIDKHILEKVPGLNINDNERRLWILNDELLYMWARSDGTNVDG